MSVMEEDEVLIRKVELTDIPYLYEICLATGFLGEDARPYYSNPYLLGQFYAAPYAYFAREDSFVLLDKATGIPSGYIVGTRNTCSFYEKRNRFLSGIKEQCLYHGSDRSVYEAKLKELILSEIDSDGGSCSLYEEYPAHFHIDLMPCMQGKKLGSELVRTFLGNLRQNDVKGVHLGVDGKNERACSFYKKEGFSVLEKTEWGFILGMKL